MATQTIDTYAFATVVVGFKTYGNIYYFRLAQDQIEHLAMDLSH